MSGDRWRCRRLALATRTFKLKRPDASFGTVSASPLWSVKLKLTRLIFSVAGASAAADPPSMTRLSPLAAGASGTSTVPILRLP